MEVHVETVDRDDEVGTPQPPDPHGRYYCTACRKRFAARGNCPRCRGETLLDLANDEVRRMLHEEWERGWQRRRERRLLLGSVGTVVGGTALVAVVYAHAGGKAAAATLSVLLLLLAIVMTWAFLANVIPRQRRPPPAEASAVPGDPDDLARWKADDRDRPSA